MSAPSASHPNKQGAGSGSLGAELTGANTVLFHMEGRLYFVSISQVTHLQARILTISSMVIATIESEIASSSEVTIK